MSMFRRIDHVGVAVYDLDVAIAWYVDTFGMRLTTVEHNAEQQVREAMLAVGEGETVLQLLAPSTPDSPIATFLDKRGVGVHQIAYTVTDVEAASALLRARGVELLYDQPRGGTAGSRVNFCHPRDVGGVLVELVEPAESVPPEPR